MTIIWKETVISKRRSTAQSKGKLKVAYKVQTNKSSNLILFVFRFCRRNASLFLLNCRQRPAYFCCLWFMVTALPCSVWFLFLFRCSSKLLLYTNLLNFLFVLFCINCSTRNVQGFLWVKGKSAAINGFAWIISIRSNNFEFVFGWKKRSLWWWYTCNKYRYIYNVIKKVVRNQSAFY